MSLRSQEMIAQALTASDYRGQHQPPKDGPPLNDLLDGSFFPDDVYETLQYYAHGNNAYDRDSIRVIKDVKGKPDAMVTIYRSAPEGSGINPGDWVCLAKGYAEMHGEGKVREYWDEDREWELPSGTKGKGEWVEYDPPRDWPVFVATVPAKYVRNGGNDILEWGYWGPPVSARVV